MDAHTGQPGSESTAAAPPLRSPSAPGSDSPADVGRPIGPYKVLSVLGEGGFGVVYLAEQTQPVRRRVALKVIKPGMDSRQVLARFEQERQALALMDHPNIAKVFDASTTAEGRPFFVMEHVRGTPITEYCDRERLTIARRLELFAPVCDAVQHAHTKGIIHRDLKPSNILVTVGEGAGARPVVIDFGVAKAVAARITEKTIYTEQGQLIGTPEYMSPEQAEMAETDIDTRTDVYALGVILYELLTGALPFDPAALRSAGYGAIQRMIREVDPPRPSARLGALGDARTGIAEARRTGIADLARDLRGELEWIPMKAMRKGRTERYRTAAELGDDIANYLAHRPLIAGPESTGYRLRKFVRRNRVAVTAGAAVCAALVLGMMGTVWQARVAAGERDAAHRARRRAETINEFMTSSLQSSDPLRGGRQDTTIAEAMAKAVEQLGAGAFEADPETEAALRNTIATILRNNGHAPDAEPLFRSALEVYRGLRPGDHFDVAQGLNNLGEVLFVQGRLAEAEPLYQQSLDMLERLRIGDHSSVAACLHNLAALRITQGRGTEAEPLAERALAMRRRVFAGDHQETASSLSLLMGARSMGGHPARAEEAGVLALEMCERLGLGDHPDVARAMANLGHVRHLLGKFAEAETLLRQALEMRERLFKDDHPDVQSNLNNLASTVQAQGRVAESEPLYLRAVEMCRRMFPGDHPDLAVCLNNLAGARNSLGQTADAEAMYLEVLDMLRRIYAGGHPYVAVTLANIARCRVQLGRLDDAEHAALEAVEMLDRIFPDGHPFRAGAMGALAAVRHAQGRNDEARDLITRAETMVLKAEPSTGPNAKAILDLKARIPGG